MVLSQPSGYFCFGHPLVAERIATSAFTTEATVVVIDNQNTGVSAVGAVGSLRTNPFGALLAIELLIFFFESTKFLSSRNYFSFV
jgi:hypothetical protein